MALWDQLFGRADLDLDGVEALRRTITATGAQERVEADITRLAADAGAALAAAAAYLDRQAGAVLAELIVLTTDRVT